MPRILYPERRWVTVEWVLGMGYDQKVNDAVDAHVKEHGVFEEPDPADPAAVDQYEQFCKAIKRPTYGESVELLTDAGTVTFARGWENDADPDFVGGGQ